MKGAYLICDGGYHHWKCMQSPRTYSSDQRFTKWSRRIESVRKDIERTFGTLKIRSEKFLNESGIHPSDYNKQKKFIKFDPYLNTFRSHRIRINDQLDLSYVGNFTTSDERTEIEEGFKELGVQLAKCYSSFQRN